jgi:hydrogenase maturation protein HypF
MYKFKIKGVVQGVGFRPYIYNACKNARLVGYVQNIGEGVVIEVDDKEKLLEILKDIPILARIDSIDIRASKKLFTDFTIKKSAGKGFAEIPPDLYLCKNCHAELTDPRDPRHGYFFITCTNCGPRFSIIKQNPYDRHTTTMADFKMCQRCEKEYNDPLNRRYHAQTIACKDCGPKLYIGEIADLGAIQKTAQLIQNNCIVAIKGIGGFHLACNTKPKTIKQLNKITGRKHKPYALMCKDIKMIREIAYVSKKEQEVLTSFKRPIVILRKKKPLNAVSELDTIGVMLPYTGLHYLLFDHLDEPVVMTSSNKSGEPITVSKNQQLVKDILHHTRKIENPVDDSLIKVIKSTCLLLRRSRGYVPQSIPIGSGSIPIKSSNNISVLALGAELNSVFSVYAKKRVFVSQYLGNTSNIAMFENYKKMLQKFLDFTNTKPEIILADAHPFYNTALYAAELSQKLGLPLVKIQHHRAHAYSVAGEHGLYDFTAIVCDGLGYGEDDNIWGGEVFVNDKRVGHLEEQYQLGGDSAVVYPGKMLFSILRKFLPLHETKKYLHNFFDDQELEILNKQYHKKFNCPLTSSAGRVLDAASFLLGFCDRRTYEARPAMILEARSSGIHYNFKPIIKNNILLTTPLFEFLVQNIGKKPTARLAATVQHYLIQGLYKIAMQYKKSLFFSGGCAYNKIMASFILEQGGRVNTKVPCGDGGISFGQLAYYLANARNNITNRH